MPATRPLSVRFWEKVDTGGPIPAHRPELGPCWTWLGATGTDGYGHIDVGGCRFRSAHRVGFFLVEGRWPMPMALHHCDNPLCVRREHLFEGDHEDNLRDAVGKGRRLRLSDETLAEIAAAPGLQRDVAKRYGIGQSTVSMIKSGKLRSA